jgi:DNA-binding IclR family transcriptional regulator
MALLEVLTQSKGGMGLAQLARIIRLPKSSTHCLLLTLQRSGYLERDENTGQYGFSLKLLSLANIPLMKLKLREVAGPFLKALVQSTGLTAHLAIQDQGEAVLIERVESPGLVKLATWVGKRMEVHCTSVGKALIAYWPEEEIARIISLHPLVRHNDNTIISFRKLKEHLGIVRKVGYSVDDEEEEVGVRCVGSPIFDQMGSVIGAISVGGTIAQVTPENLSSIAGKVKSAARAISQQLGYASENTQERQVK